MHGTEEALRDYQQAMKRRLWEAWALHRNVMVQMPTGTGKTHLLAAIVREFLRESEHPVWIVAHRRELVEQIEATVDRYGMQRADGRVKVMSIQWLSRRRMEEQPGLIVIDEAHHALAETYRALWKRYPDVRKLGMTATPCRLNGNGFLKLFGSLITSWSIAEFIREGWLSAFDYVSIRANSREQRLIDSLRKRGADGDYQVKEMNAVLNRSFGIGRLYEGLQRYAAGKKGIVYAVSIDHARRIAAYYTARGVTAVAIDSRTPAAERRRLVEAFRQGSIRVLVNVDIFSEGFDCPDVEFVQLARPTLSLAKYLQQVGRGLRLAKDKEACVLIDQVGLYRLFGLPTRHHDWDAMFEGRVLGNALSRARMEHGGASLCLPVPPADEAELEVVITHGQLIEAIRKDPKAAVAGPAEPAELRAWHDRTTGLWGLRRGEVLTVRPQYPEVFDVSGDWAAVRWPDHRAGVVDDAGTPRVCLAHCGALKFLKADLLAVTDEKGQPSYLDLQSGRTYKEKPVVLRFGSVELLKVGAAFCSRTRKAYVAMRKLDKHSLRFCDFYLRIPDYRLPKDCRLVDPVWSAVFDAFACLLEDDNEQVYWFCGPLADGSIVVMDEENYYHVEPGRRKRRVSPRFPGPDEAPVEEVLECLRRAAEERVAEKRRRALQAEAQQRRQRLVEIRAALPFCMGTKWGLKLGERIVVPPRYRKILPPVGNYCAYEGNACQWGVMALDGKVVVEARYQEVRIERNGTVHLTVIPGKVKTIKL